MSDETAGTRRYEASQRMLARALTELREAKEAGRVVLDIITAQGHIDNCGHRRRGSHCASCRAVYALADACEYELRDKVDVNICSIPEVKP